MHSTYNARTTMLLSVLNQQPNTDTQSINATFNWTGILFAVKHDGRIQQVRRHRDSARLKLPPPAWRVCRLHSSA